MVAATLFAMGRWNCHPKQGHHTSVLAGPEIYSFHQNIKKNLNKATDHLCYLLSDLGKSTEITNDI